MSKWFIRPCKVDIGNMCRKMGINVPLALALQAKGLNTPKKVKDYFNTENYSSIGRMVMVSVIGPFTA